MEESKACVKVRCPLTSALAPGDNRRARLDLDAVIRHATHVANRKYESTCRAMGCTTKATILLFACYVYAIYGLLLTTSCTGLASTRKSSS